MMTQLARVSEARDITLDRVDMIVTPRFEQTGSIRGDDVQSRLLDVDTDLQLESSADQQQIESLVTTAERMCFLMDTIRNPHSVTAKVSLNGAALDTE
ncbi:MAG: hypothetical protein ACR2PZ_21115 [Pseudomonadales bacterium]